MQYLVTRLPKPRYRAGMVVVAMVVEATSGAAAIRRAFEVSKMDAQENWFGGEGLYNKPNAEPLKMDSVIRL